MGKKVCIVSLGCPKNTVDSESLLRGLGIKGVAITREPAEADVIAVNTCCFIDEAKQESVDEILRLSALRAEGRKLVVFGCMAERFGAELAKELPEVDALFGLGQERRILRYLSGGAPEVAFPSALPAESARVEDGPHRYLKISEGCSRKCTYCVIPAIRGPMISRNAGDVLVQAGEFVAAGARELVLIAQDITSYGRDLNDVALPVLLRRLSAIEGDFWIRLLYLHPDGITDELLGVIAGAKKVCKYIDLPLQHSESRVLKRMGRTGGSHGQYLKLIARIRSAVPGVTLRTSFIVGFPGETEAESEGLMDFVEEAAFERLGVFRYSREEGTPAASMHAQVPEEIKAQRMDFLMNLQADISLGKNKALLGTRARALIEEVSPPGRQARGRLCSQAPEVDGHTVVTGPGLREGEFVNVRITGATDYDLEARTEGQ